MKKVTMAFVDYEAPQITTVQLVTEQTVLSGSLGSMLEDMYESTDGEWADFYR